MANATTESFFTHTKGGKLIVKNPLGGNIEIPYTPESRDSADRRVLTAKRNILDQLEKKIGRPPTVNEVMQGCCDVEDDRTYQQKLASSDWRPVLREGDSNLHKLLDQTQDELDKENVYKNMSRLEARKFDLENMIDKDAAKKAEEQRRVEHLKKKAPILSKLDEMIFEENWNPNASEAFRSLLRRTREQVAHPDGDPVTTHQMLRGVEGLANQRTAARRMALSNRINELAVEMESVTDAMLTETEEAPAAPQTLGEQ